MMDTPHKERIVWYDVVRLLAMYLLVCCHSADPFNYALEGSPMIADVKFWGALWGSMMRPCVPLFVMLTGALLLPQQGSVGPFYKKRISRVFWPFLIWSVIYCLFPVFLKLLGGGPQTVRDFIPYADEDFLAQSLPLSLKHIARIPLNFSSMDVLMWYIYLIIGLYLYIPIFSAWVEKASRKAKRWFLIAWGITLVLPYYNYYIDPYLWGSCAWNQFGALYYFAGFNGYLLLGHYLKDAEWSLGKTLLLGVPMFAVGYFTTFLGFRHMTGIPGFTEPMAELFWTFNSFNVVLMVIPLFMICKKVKVKNERIKAMLADLTKCGFGIYMIHYLLIGPGILLMRALHIPLGMQIPLGAICALAASWTIVTIAHRILPSKAARVIFG